MNAHWTRAGLLACILAAGAGMAPAAAQTCPDDFCTNPADSLCDSGGFLVRFTGYVPGSASNDGSATYTYEICSPVEGVCSLDPARTCLDNGQCAKHSAGTCSRQCAVDSFRGLSHFDIFFPELGFSCMTDATDVSGTCACTEGSSPGCSVQGNAVIGDGSCFGPDTPVLKCDSTELPPGDCITMTLSIAGELTGLGEGATVVVSKESTDCNESCILGPSCNPCNPGTGGGACLTRTIGFWGNHPQITGLHVPVTVCGNEVFSTDAGTCDSVAEALCSTPGLELHSNPPYVSLVRQLAAAKINLNVTAALDLDGDTLPDGNDCADYEDTGAFYGSSIQEIIALCEAQYCDAAKKDISESGCIEALDAFNQSQDTGLEQTPAPFDRPGPAQPGECQEAGGTRGNPRLVIGKTTKDADCS